MSEEQFTYSTRMIGEGDVSSNLLRDLIEPSQAQNDAWEKHRAEFSQAGSVEPIVDKGVLCRRVALSAPIKENIAVYENAIEGFGYDLIPVLDPDADGAKEQVKLSIWYKAIEERDLRFEGRLEEALKGKASEKDRLELEVEILSNLPSDEELEPSEEEIRTELIRIKNELQFQRIKAKRFLSNVARVNHKPVGLVALRKVLRNDLEVTGECMVEVLRDGRGNLRRFVHLKSVSVRQMPLSDRDTFAVNHPERVDPFTIRMVEETRTFRRFVQVDPESFEKTFFKSLGDPRIISNKTGKEYETIEALRKDEKDAKSANELIYWGLYDPESIYGGPRWFCLSADVVGHHKSSEINYLYFDNKGIPPFLVTVAGGSLTKGMDKKIGELLGKLKGSDSFHKILVLEAVPPKSNGFMGATPQKVTIEVQPLIKFLPEDALFQEYQKNTEERIAAIYRNPPLLRGRTQDYTRATSREATKFFEQFVGIPERQRFDDTMNFEVFPLLGLTLLTFKSRGPDTADPEVQTKVIDVLSKWGGLVPRDVRQEAERLLGRELGNIDHVWASSPLPFTTVGISSGAVLPPGVEQNAQNSDTNEEKPKHPVRDPNFLESSE